MTNFLVLAGGHGTFSTAEPKPLRLGHGVRVRAAAVPVQLLFQCLTETRRCSTQGQ